MNRPISAPLPQPAATNSQRALRLRWTVAGVCVIAVGLAAAVRMTGEPAREEDKASAPRPKPVRVAAARQETIPLLEEYRGELVARTAELATQGAGTILEVRVDLGEQFERGDLLALVDATETRRRLAEARAQGRSAAAAEGRAEAELAAAEVEAERARNLMAENLLSAQDALLRTSHVSVLQAEIKTAQAQRAAAEARVQLHATQLAQAELRAPFDGAVAERYLDPGSLAQPGTRILRLVERGPLELRFRASERHIRRLKIGSPVWVTTAATGSTRHAGRVVRVSAEVSRLDRSVAVEAQLSPGEAAPPDGASAVPGERPAADERIQSDLRPGMYATVHLELGTLEAATLVPASAIVERFFEEGSVTGENSGLQRQTGVFVVKDSLAHWTVVESLGRHKRAGGSRATSGEEVAVRPLSPTEQVVVFGHDALRDGDPIQIASAEP